VIFFGPGRVFDQDFSLTVHESVILPYPRVEAVMFVSVWFIAVAIGLLIAVAFHSCNEDRTSRNRVRVAEWSR
jgi:hypothetical protein